MSEKAKSSKSERCAQWIENYGDDLFKYAYARVRDRNSAEDIVQECFLAACQNPEAFQETSTVKTWLIGILRHKIADYYRKKSRRSIQSLSKEAEASDGVRLFKENGFWSTKPQKWALNPAKTLENKEFWLVFEECLSKLPPPTAEVFYLREVENVSSKEICSTLNITSENFSVRMYRARVVLRSCLEQNWFHNS